MKKFINEILLPILGFIAFYIFSYNAITPYGVFFFTILLFGCCIYTYFKDKKEYDKKSCIAIVIVYYITILISLNSISKSNSQGKEDSYYNGYSSGYENGYSEGVHDTENKYELG